MPPNPSELLQIQRLDDMFVQLRVMYDYIIIDSAPVGMVSDTFSLARLADVTVYVVRADYTRVSDVRFVNDMSKTTVCQGFRLWSTGRGQRRAMATAMARMKGNDR